MRNRRQGWLLVALVVCVVAWLCRDRVLDTAAAVAPPSIRSSVAPVTDMPGARRDTEATMWAKAQAQFAQRAADPAAARRIARCTRDFEDNLTRKLDAARASPDAHGQLAVAFVTALAVHHPGTAAEARRELERIVDAAYATAVAAAPDDPLVVWAHARHCGAEGRCDRDAAVRRLQELEPDNAAVWLFALEQPRAAADPAEAERLLRRAAQSAYYESHYSDTVLLAMDEVGGTAWPPSCDAALEDEAREAGLGRAATRDDIGARYAQSGVALLATDLHPALRRLCPYATAGAPRVDRLPACIGALTRLAAGDTIIDQMVALPRLADWTAGEPEGPYWQERWRNFRWLQQEGWRHARHAPLRAIWEQGEVGLYQSALEAAGRWPAPRGWIPEER